jgi:hypothetical protein
MPILRKKAKTGFNTLVIVSTEIDKLLMKGAIKEVDAVEDQFISNLFLVPKKDGSFRPVINLKTLGADAKPKQRT